MSYNFANAIQNDPRIFRWEVEIYHYQDDIYCLSSEYHLTINNLTSLDTENCDRNLIFILTDSQQPNFLFTSNNISILRPRRLQFKCSLLISIYRYSTSLTYWFSTSEISSPSCQQQIVLSTIILLQLITVLSDRISNIRSLEVTSSNFHPVSWSFFPSLWFVCWFFIFWCQYFNASGCIKNLWTELIELLLLILRCGVTTSEATGDGSYS